MTTEVLTDFIHTENSKTVRYRSEELVYEEKEESIDPRKLGEAVHAVLEKITDANQQLAPILQPIAEKLRLTESDISHIGNMVEKVVQHPKLNTYFQQGAFQTISEQDMINPVGKGIIYRADRILLDGKNAILIDYKTGKKEDHLLRKHQKQVERYAQILTEMGFSVVKKLLVYTEAEEVEMVVEWK